MRVHCHQFMQHTVTNDAQLKANVDIAVQQLIGQQQHLREVLSSELASQLNQSGSVIAQHISG